jgi:phage/conjugal plasmid C-4 type zinc finger TraR family protein
VDTGKFAMELAEYRVEQERDASLARIRRALSKPGDGASHCSCGAVIPEARRKALPGVVTCIDCARRAETRKR